jgi:hypothetical protein
MADPKSQMTDVTLICRKCRWTLKRLSVAEVVHADAHPDRLVAYCLSCDAVRRFTVDIEKKAEVHLFRRSGKYYTEEMWRIPKGAIGPYDMVRSVDFHRIDGGPVLVVTQEPWGFPHLLVSEGGLVNG